MAPSRGHKAIERIKKGQEKKQGPKYLAEQRIVDLLPDGVDRFPDRRCEHDPAVCRKGNVAERGWIIVFLKHEWNECRRQRGRVGTGIVNAAEERIGNPKIGKALPQGTQPEKIVFQALVKIVIGGLGRKKIDHELRVEIFQGDPRMAADGVNSHLSQEWPPLEVEVK